MNLRVELRNSRESGILWSGISGRQIGKLEPNQEISLTYTFLPIKAGLQVSKYTEFPLYMFPKNAMEPSVFS